MKEELAFEEWLPKVSGIIEKMQIFSKDAMPRDGGEISEALSLAFEYRQSAGEFLADVENYIRHLRGKYTLDSKTEYPNLTGPERKAIVESKLSVPLRVRDILSVTYSTLREKCYALQRINQ